MITMNIVVEFAMEADGRWIAEVTDLPGAMVYGNSKEEALRNAYALVLDVLSDEIKNGERELASVENVHFIHEEAA